MNKINKMITKYSDLIRMMEAYRDGEKIEWLSCGHWYEVTDQCIWKPDFEYRIKPKQQDSIDVSHVHPMWKFMARDEDGAVFLYSNSPRAGYTAWSACGEVNRIVGYKGSPVFSSYSRGETHCRESLVDLDELREALK